MRFEVWVVCLSLALGARSIQDGQGVDGTSGMHARARELFLANCATCHGESGDGDGWTELDRPARSFKDGGFSFGNTPEALFRTISTGIPGTPMPGFDTSLDEDDRRALAAYVRELGPPIEDVDTSRAVMTVGARARVVRGHLPPIAEGTDARPRGLLFGTPSGLTYEYRVDDVRLLGVRLGAFVNRRDWVGRGGTPLEPLGRVLQLIERGDPEAPFSLADGQPLAARLTGTWTLEQDAGLAYRLVDAAGSRVADVHERPTARVTSRGTVLQRRFRVEATDDVRLVLRVPLLDGLPILEQLVPTATGAGPDVPPSHWIVQRRPDGAFLCTGVAFAADVALVTRGGRVAASLDARAGEPVELTLQTVIAPMWTDEIRATLAGGGPR